MCYFRGKKTKPVAAGVQTAMMVLVLSIFVQYIEGVFLEYDMEQLLYMFSAEPTILLYCVEKAEPNSIFVVVDAGDRPT